MYVDKVEHGEFGAYMQVELLNDRSFTLVLDSDMIVKKKKELEHVCKLLSVGGASHFSGEGRNGFKHALDRLLRVDCEAGGAKSDIEKTAKNGREEGGT